MRISGPRPSAPRVSGDSRVFLFSQRSPAVNAIPEKTAGDRTAIRQFQVNIPEAKLIDLRKRISATVWPEMETVPDSSQGVPLATMQALAATGRPTTTGERSRRS